MFVGRAKVVPLHGLDTCDSNFSCTACFVVVVVDLLFFNNCKTVLKLY